MKRAFEILRILVGIEAPPRKTLWLSPALQWRARDGNLPKHFVSQILTKKNHKREDTLACTREAEVDYDDIRHD